MDEYEKRLPIIRTALRQGDERAIDRVQRIVALKREALLSSPLLDFDRLLVIRRKPFGDPRRPKAALRGMAEYFGLPQQASWQLDRIRQPYGWDNEIAVLSNLRSTPTLKTLYRPPTPRLVSDIELHFDADKLLFSMPGSEYRWQIFEINADGTASLAAGGTAIRPLTRGDIPDVHCFDGCYLPNGKIAFVSTAALQGVPCSDGINVATAYLMDGDGKNVRQIGFDQDHDYCPTLMNDGRILYLRWEYTDLPHVWGRYLFTMNPDGTGQRAFYGSGEYWPNAIFHARPVPNHPTKVIGVVTGHHVGRMGELMMFDPAGGRNGVDGVVQRIPGYGQKVEPIIMDKLTLDSWPKFTHPYPLSEKYMIVSSKPTAGALWGIYLVDERPLSAITIEKPFWMGRFEVTNRQYQQFDPNHDSRFEHKGSWVFSERHLGWPLDGLRQPVVRVSQQEADAFCRWLSAKVGQQITLPTEAQWEYACRAGSADPLAYGDVDTDFSKLANMADVTIRQLAYDTDGRHTADLVPRIVEVDDGTLVTADVGSYRANTWGLHDMHGNVWEWTRSAYRPYPYRAADGRNDPADTERRVVRGGSWRDRPKRCRSAFRLSYPAWQQVFNVGFRVVCPVEEIATPEEAIGSK